MKKLIFGLIISAVFVYFSLRGLDFTKIAEGLRNVNYIYLLPVAAFFLILMFIRSLRWGFILSPIVKIDQRRLLPITCVGFMSVVLVPMRLGEAVRPYLLSAKGYTTFSSGLATVFVERVFDVMTILAIFLIVLIAAPLPDWLVKSGYTAAFGFVLMVSFMVFLYFKRESALKMIRPFLKILPERFGHKIESLVRNFIDGFRIIASPSRMLGILLLSVLIWVLSGLSIYTLFKFQGLELSMLAALVVLVVNIVGISLPTAPGMLGNFQFSCIVALSLFKIDKDPAFVFSMVYYFMGIGMIILTGLWFLPKLDVSLKDAVNDIKKGFI